MNPEFKKEEIKYFKNLVEIQLGITKVVLEEHKKRERIPCECDCCDAPKPGGPLTTRQPAENLYISDHETHT